MTEIDRKQMDNVEFDILLESVERRMRQKADEIGETRKKILDGGLLKFDTIRIVNDLMKIIDQLQRAEPENFVQTFPMKADESGGAVIDTKE